MKWARLTRDHRFLEMKHALYIPSLCLGLILPAGSFKNTYFIIFVYAIFLGLTGTL